MKTGIRGVVSILTILSLSSLSNASSGTNGAAFLDIPVGAGPAALGGAYTALATNAYAPTWNPAGLGRLTGTEVSGQHLSYLESMNYEYFSVAHPFNKEDSTTHRGIGFSMQYLGSGEIDRTDIKADGMAVNDGNPIGTYTSHYASYNFSYGQTLGEKLAVGLTGKVIQAKLDDVGAHAYAADFGALYKANEQIELGAALVNMGSSLKFLTDGDSLPMAFKVGVAYRPNTHFLVSSEGVYEKDDVASFHTGAEWRPIEMLSLRMGYRTDTLKGLSPLAGFSTGLGLHMWGQEFAYAWMPYGDLGDTQYVSLLLHFGVDTEARRNLIQYQNIKKHRVVRNPDAQRGVRNRSNDDDATEPEYQQLMQLLSADDVHSAQAPKSSYVILPD